MAEPDPKRTLAYYTPGPRTLPPPPPLPDANAAARLLIVWSFATAALAMVGWLAWFGGVHPCGGIALPAIGALLATLGVAEQAPSVRLRRACVLALIVNVAMGAMFACVIFGRGLD